MKLIIKSMIYSLFLALSLNFSSVMADEIEGRVNAENSQSEVHANEKGLEGRAKALLLEEQAREMAASYAREARANQRQAIRTRPNFARPTWQRPTR